MFLKLYSNNQNCIPPSVCVFAKTHKTVYVCTFAWSSLYLYLAKTTKKPDRRTK